MGVKNKCPERFSIFPCRIKAKMKTVNQIMIEGEDVEIGSDSDVSDTSQISILNHVILNHL